MLLDTPGVGKSVCVESGCPASLKLLRSENSASKYGTHSLLCELSSGPVMERFRLYEQLRSFCGIPENALLSNDEGIMRRTIEITRGVTRGRILPLPIRTRDKQGIEWTYNRNNVHGFDLPSPRCWGA